MRRTWRQRPRPSPNRSWRRPTRLSERMREDFIMTDDTRDNDGFWYRGKVTRRRVIGYGVSAGALGATMLVPAPWQAAFGQAKPYKIGTLQPLSGAGAAGGKTALVGLQMAVDRINEIRRHQRPAGRDRGRRRRVQARRRPPQDREAAGRGQDRRPRRRLPLQHLPRLHAGVRGAQGRQHDQRVPRHHADDHQVQPLQLPRPRLCAVAGGGLRARARQEDGQEVAHRLRRLFVGPVDHATPMPTRSRRRAARWSAPPAFRSAPPT